MLRSVISLVQDRRGRFSWLRALTLAILVAPALRLSILWAMGGLGGRPVMEFTHGTGDWAIYFLLAALAVSPLRTILDAQRLVVLRRMIGVAVSVYTGIHLCLYVIDQRFDLIKVVTEIAVRFYLTIGFVTFLGFLALAVVSTDGWVRRMGRKWKRLQRLVYPLAVLALFHYYLQSKADVSAAVFVSGIFLWEMIWRLTTPASRLAWWPLPLISVAAALATAGVEGAWYALATRIDPIRVLSANLDVSFGPRPAVAILLCGWAFCAIALVQRRRLRRAALA